MKYVIRGSDGSEYLTRWSWWLGRWRVMLHRMHRPDEDMCLHDHPWSFVTLVLAGGYWEVLPNGRRRWNGPVPHAHRVGELPKGYCCVDQGCVTGDSIRKILEVFR